MVPVSEAVYRVWWQETEHARYLEQEARSREESFQREGAVPDEDFLALRLGPTAERPDYSALYAALADEPPELVEALWQLACGEATQEEIAQRWGSSRRAARDRIDRAYARLQRKILKKK